MPGNMEDVADRNGDGISGRVNEVWDLQAGALAPGRFGLKANSPNLLQQSAEAYLNDISGLALSGPARGRGQMKDTAHCTRKLLAVSSICTVEECDCGTVHLTVGALTLRLEREALRDLQGALASALANLTGSRDHRPAATN